MVQHKAILIQNLAEYYALILPHLQRALDHYRASPNSQHISIVELFQWIVREEFSRVYSLYPQHHIRRHVPHEVLYENVQRSLSEAGFSLNRLTSFYIKAPRIYPDSDEIEIRFSMWDLYITYKSTPTINPFLGLSR